MKIKRFTSLIIWLLLPFCMFAQTNISTAEYWYDGDYSTANRQSVTPGTSVSYTDLLNISSLEPGLHTASFRFQDDRGVWGSLLTKFFTYYPESTSGPRLITDVEYWYDNDYTSAIKTTLTPVASVNWNTLLNVSSLIEGLHTVTCRFKDNRGTWSAPYIYFFKIAKGGGLQQIVGFEYWFNTDYAGKFDSTFSATSILNLDKMLDVSSLSSGLHFLNIRLQDESGRWNTPISWFFVKDDKETPVLQEITAMEYWYDGDYSTVKNNPVAATALFNLNDQLDFSALNNGLHAVSCRFLNKAGNWSPAYSSLFVKYPPDPSPNMHDLVAMEYWIDGDISSKVNTSITPGSEYMQDTQLDISALNDGLHFITYRFQDEAGNWSAGSSHLFNKYKNEIITTNNKITAYRYWADNQIGSAIKTGLTIPVKSLILDELIDISSFQSGEHLASFQFQDEQGLWSSAISQTYHKTVQPTLRISASDSSVCTGSQVNFTADYTDADLIEWNFGDGNISNEFNPEHSYAEAGIFEVSAIVTHTDSMKSAYDTIVGGITVNATYDTWLEINDTLKICESNLPFVLGSQHITAEGFYTETFTTIHGCDSVVSVNLVINPSDSVSFADTVCEGDLPYIFGTQNLVASGVYTENFPTAHGCDSVVTLDLVVSDTSVITNAVTICETDLPYFFGGSALTSGGIYTEVFTTVNGCDSTVTLSLTVNDTSLTELEMSVCENDFPLIIGADTFYNEGIYTKKLNNTLGCDSTVILSLNVLDTSLVAEELEICENLLPFTFGTQSLSAGGVYSETFIKNNGCDSTVILTLIVKDTFVVSESVLACETGLPYTFGTQSLLVNGTYTEQFTASTGCDSTVIISFFVLDSSLVEQEITICESELPYAFGSQTLDSGGVFTEVYSSENGCDSTVVLTLNVLDSTLQNKEVNICAGDVPYIFGTQSLSASGIFTEVFTGSNGCDSTVVLNLVVNDTFRTADTLFVCENELPYTFGTQSLVANGTYTGQFSSSSGCDSIVDLVFTVNDISQSAFADTVCENELPYIFGSQSISASGVYTETFAAANNCDSMVTLELTVHKSFNFHIYETISPSELPYVFGSQQLTKSGVFSNTLATSFGCDSTIILHLQVRDYVPPVAKCNPIEVELNQDGSYSLNDFDLADIAQGSTDDISGFEDLEIIVSPSAFTCENVGENAVSVKVKDAVGNLATCETTVTVANLILNPKIDKVPDQVTDEDSTLQVILTGISGGTVCETWDVDLSATSRNTGLVTTLHIDHSPDDTTAILAILLHENQHGTDSILVTVQDSLGNTTDISFLFTVNAVNDHPVIIQEIEDQMITAGDSATITVSKIPGEYFYDIDDTIFVFNLSLNEQDMPDWIAIRENNEQYIFTFTPAEPDTGCFNFVLTIEDETGETTQDSFSVCIDALEVGIPNLEEGNFDINLYPNPTGGEVNINIVNPPLGEIELLVTNIAGSQVLRKTYQNGERIIFNLSENISGTYLVILQTKNKRIVRKLILDKQ